MMNFALGTAAGALIAAVVTIAAVRQPDVQTRLGLFPAALSAPAPAPTHPEASCPPRVAAAPVGTQDMLLSKRRFWLVAPQ